MSHNDVFNESSPGHLTVRMPAVENMLTLCTSRSCPRGERTSILQFKSIRMNLPASIRQQTGFCLRADKGEVDANSPMEHPILPPSSNSRGHRFTWARKLLEKVTLAVNYSASYLTMAPNLTTTFHTAMSGKMPTKNKGTHLSITPPESPPLPLAGAKESSSSKNSTHGAADRAWANTSRTFRSDSPTYISRSCVTKNSMKSREFCRKKRKRQGKWLI